MTWCVINLKDNINIAFIFLKIKNAALTRLPVWLDDVVPN